MFEGRGVNFERRAVLPGEVLTVAEGFALVVGGVLRVDGFVRLHGVLVFN